MSQNCINKLPMISYVYRPRRRQGGKLEISRIYRARFRLAGERAVTDISLHTSDKLAAERKLVEFVAEREREKAGIIAPRLQRDSAQKAILLHLEDFLSDLATLGRCRIYQKQVSLRIRRIVTEQGWRYPGEFTIDGFVSWRSRQTELGPKTLNEYLNSLQVFLNWMERHGRIASNPLRNATKVDTRGKGQCRRAFTDEELRKVLQVAGNRRALYVTAAYTGLRAGELRQLVWNDVQLDATPARLKIRASTAKNRRDAIIALHPNVVAELRKLRTSTAVSRPNGPVFPASNRTAPHMRKHLLKAGVEPMDDNGRKLDFHALRNTFATKLARNGVSQRTAQELLRHSDPRLTANIYTDATQLPSFDSVAGLPWHDQSEDLLLEKDTQIDSQNSDSDVQSRSRIAERQNRDRRTNRAVERHGKRFWSLFGTRSTPQVCMDAEGFEQHPIVINCCCKSGTCQTGQTTDTQLDSQSACTTCLALSKVVSRWAQIPEAIRRAIGALVDSQEPGVVSSQ